jgi:glycosyltransferase involved in cell wall biosynthesis
MVKNVMFVTNSLTGGGAERSMNMVCNELTLRNWNVTLVPVNKSESDLIQLNSAVYPLNRVQNAGLVGTLRAIIKLNIATFKFQPRVIVLNCDAPEFLGLFLVKKVKIVIVQHSSQPWITRQRLGILVRKILSIRTKYFMAVSDHLSIWPEGETPYQVIANPVSPNLNDYKFPETNTLKRIAFIGRMSKEKQPEIPLEIAKVSGLPVVMIGDGDLKLDLVKHYKKLDSEVHWTGQLREPWESIKEGDVLIIPSAYEGDGLVILEGLQRGVPMLVSDIPDFRRFGFPEINYCVSIEDYYSRLMKHSDDLQSLVVPSEIATNILSKRDIHTLGNQWEIALGEIIGTQ